MATKGQGLPRLRPLRELRGLRVHRAQWFCLLLPMPRLRGQGLLGVKRWRLWLRLQGVRLKAVRVKGRVRVELPVGMMARLYAITSQTLWAAAG